MADLDLLHQEIDRQLAEVRAASDGLATRAGLLFAASGVAAAILAPSVNAGRHEILLVLTLAAFALATLAGGIALMPWMQIGQRPTFLASSVAQPNPYTTSALFDGKITILDGNLSRLQAMRIFFTIQAAVTVVAVALALSYLAWK